VRAAAPNAAHLALARAEARLRQDQRFLLVTQNVDGLHARAGSARVVELHGSVLRTRCPRDGCALEPYADVEPHGGPAPTCPHCRAILRPDVVLFGEPLPAEGEWEVKRALRDCDLFVAIGTSGTVSPAADYVRAAEYAGARTVLVNLEPMRPPNPYFLEQHLGRAEEILPKLLG
jgi:NAD-dependent deacetylase